MATLRSTCSGSLALSLGWVLLIGTGRVPLHAGEPIQISGFTNKVSLPRKDSTDSVLNPSSDIFKSGRSDNPGSDLPDTTPTPNRTKNRRAQELLDRQKNWMFQTPETMKAEPTPEEMFGLEENPWSTRSKPSSRMLENFWKDKERKSPQKNPYSSPDRSESDTDDKDKAVLENSTSGILGTDARDQSRELSTLNWNSLFNEKGRSNGQNRDSKELIGGLFNQKNPSASSSLVSGLETPEFKTPQKERDDDFFKILNPSASKTFLPARYDPINSAFDSTRRDINPVVGRTVEDFSAANPLGALSGLQANGFVPPGLQPPAFDDLNARLRGQPSFKPAFEQSEPRFLTPRPAVLEFPKRKF
jgi:hypothetical protein